MSSVLFILITIVFILMLIVTKVLGMLSPKELKRRAAKQKKPGLDNLHNLVSYGRSTFLVLGLLCLVCLSVMLYMSAQTGWWMMLITLLASSWLVFVWDLPASKGWYWPVSFMAAPLLVRIVGIIYPLTSRFIGSSDAAGHNIVYEKDDLIELLLAQRHQTGNRIPDIDLQIAGNALCFGDKRVSDVMTPRRSVTFVKQNDSVGPKLMDELHASGFSRFPVVKDSTKTAQITVVGTLFLRDLIANPGEAKVSDLMDKKVFFVNESQDLRSCLEAFLKTHHHLLIVVNSFEEIAGVIALEDVLEQVMGKKIVDEFDKYDDIRAVANMEANKEHSHHTEIKKLPADQPTVVE